MRKKEFLKHWRKIPQNQTITPTPIEYGHTGSTFDQDGIRITGSKEYIDSVLSRLKGLLDYEGAETRLHISYSQATDRHTSEPLNSYKCYIQVHERGRRR